MLAAPRTSAYPYARGNLLEQPEFYMYSDCFGELFVRDFLASRRQMLEELSLRHAAVAPGEGATGPEAWETMAGRLSASGKASAWWDALDASPSIMTEEVLRAALAAGVGGCSVDAARAAAWVDRLVAKFEITRRLYASYTPAMKPDGTEFARLTNYALLSMNAGLFHERTKRWQLLNAALKLNDLLGSCQTRLQEPEDLLFATLAIWKELELVSRLADAHQVPR